MMADKTAEADLRQRRAAFQKLSMADRTARHQALAERKAESLSVRRELGQRYLARHTSPLSVEPDRAVAFYELVEETRAARVEAAGLAEGRDATVNNGALEFPALAHEFDADGPSIRLGTSPLVLEPVVRYLGMMPVLFNMFVTRAHQAELLDDSAHFFHLDPEDTRSFKVFVHLTDVDDGCGPFHALPADVSAKVLEAVDYRGVTMLSDERIAELAGWEPVVQVTGPAGTVALADTTRCLHFGGRPRQPGKPVREMLVYQYLLPTSILLNTDGPEPPRNFFPQLAATGDDQWDALIGARFL